MGRPKLLLPFGEERLVDRLLRAWTSSIVSEVVVVVRAGDDELAEACAAWPVQVVRPEVDPDDMAASIRIGLNFLNERLAPDTSDGCFLAPADLPRLTAGLINRVATAKKDDSSVVVPYFGDRSGHPLLFPWPATSAVMNGVLAEGLRSAVEQCGTTSVSFGVSERPTDINTPADYEAAVQGDNRA